MVLPLEMGWRHLLFANWPVDPAVVDAHLPDGFDVDAYDGRKSSDGFRAHRNSPSSEDGNAWLSVVPFTNVDVRPKGLPRAAGIRLPELNLRTYVTRDGEPGVYFFSLDAHGVLAVLGARLFHHLPYFYARMSLRTRGDRVRFESRRLHPGDRPARYVATYGPTGPERRSEEGSLAKFLTDRHRLYTQVSDGSIRYTDVDHPPWTLAPATVDAAENTLFAADGFEHPEGEPVLYYSRGVDVVIEPSRRWTDR